MSLGRGCGGTGRFPHTRPEEEDSWGKHGFPHGSEPAGERQAHGSPGVGRRGTSTSTESREEKSTSDSTSTCCQRSVLSPPTKETRPIGIPFGYSEASPFARQPAVTISSPTWTTSF